MTTNALGFGTNSGTGTLLVSDGGIVTVNSAASSVVLLGDVGGTGSILASGPNSTLSTAAPLYIGKSDATGTLAIASGGMVNAVTARETGATGTLNIGAAPGGAPVAPGVLETPEVVFGAGAGSLNFNHTASDYEFPPAISGNGNSHYHGFRADLTVTF